MEKTSPDFKFYDDSLVLFNALVEDILNAQKYVYIQTYRFGNDPIGERFRDVLVRKAREGVKVKVLADSWGTTAGTGFFNRLTSAGGEVVFFEKLKFSLNVFSRNHRRNHRKLVIIDDNISYIGSVNFANYSINWRESMLRLEGSMASALRNIFMEDYTFSKKIFPNKRKYTRTIKHGNFEIIRDIPSTIFQPTRKLFLKLIKTATESVTIETPYFLPGSIIRKELIRAAQRGVNIRILTPLHSDVSVFDILRDKYWGFLHKKNIQIFFYTPQNLHAKVMVVDDRQFVLGSSNMDYRSFRFMHEINILGRHPGIIQSLQNHFEQTISDSVPFDYNTWKNRSYIQKVIEWLLVPIRHLF